MRTAFIKTLIDLARADQRIFLLVGDLGYSVVEPFAREFPNRFINAGVAEQNMTGVATGLALEGKTVFTYSIANFPTLRCLEQIRNDVCYHNVNVNIVSIGSGLAYGALGSTHHGTEDIAIMRSLPNMTVVAPGDPVEASLATQAVAGSSGPCYLRLGKAGEPIVHQKTPEFAIGKAIELHSGRDITLIATGGVLHIAMQAVERLEKDGIGAQLLSMHTVKPIDGQAVLTAALETGAIVTIEEHGIIGGLGSAVSEVLAESGTSPVSFKRIGLDGSFCTEVGSQQYLRELYSLSVEGIAGVARSLLGKGDHDGL